MSTAVDHRWRGYHRPMRASEVGEIRSLILKHVREAFLSQDEIDRQWSALNYTGRPDFTRAVREYDALADLLRGLDIELHFQPEDRRTGPDSLYVRDASVVCQQGVILCNMGKADRLGEPAAQRAFYEQLGVPIHGAIAGDGTFEGGDLVWLDDRTPVVGLGYRTNAEGIRQLEDLLYGSIDELIVVPLPHWRGPDDVFHLMSILSPVDRDLAVVYSPLMPVPLRQRLLARGMQLVEVPDSEFDSLGCNVLAVAPRQCVMVEGNPLTRQLLEGAGARVLEFSGREICLRGAGGPTCLTRPLLRGS